jgi:hypothetical protein
VPPVSLDAAPVALQRLIDRLDCLQIERDLTQLCASAFAGRRIGTEGHDRAQRWLHDTMQALELAVTTVNFVTDAPVLDVYAPPAMMIVDAADVPLRTLAHRRDFAEHPHSIDQPALITGVAQPWYTTADVHDAWVILEDAPQGPALNQLAAQLARQDAVGLLVAQHADSEGYLRKRIVAASPIVLPVLTVRTDLLTSLVGQRVCASVPLRRLVANGQHVLGQLDGTDSSLAHAPLIIGAHYDGVGDDPGGLRIPGAADNAAGVAVVLELARILQASEQRPRRPIIIAAFDGEEMQAAGSRAHAAQLQREGVMPFVINLDGAAQFHEAVWVELGAGAERLSDAYDLAGQWLAIPLVLGPVASDNRRYAAAGFPTVGVALGGASGHSPGDVPDRVDRAAMQLAARLCLAAIWQLAF